METKGGLEKENDQVDCLQPEMKLLWNVSKLKASCSLFKA